MRNAFLSSLRHLSEGTRLYGRDQPGQMAAILALSVYIPLTLPLLREGVWIGFSAWIEAVTVPGPGLILAGYAVIVAIVIALALTPPSIAANAPLAPYPVERPVKSRIIHNCRLFLGSMIGLGFIGVLFTSGIERLEHLVCAAVGALLLQLGHLDEVNAAQADAVLELLGDEPLQGYDRWYAKQWGRPRAGRQVRARASLVRRKLWIVVLMMLVHLGVLVAYIAVVHGTAGLARHWATVLFLSSATSVVNLLIIDAVLAASLAIRHSRGSRYSTWVSHPETYFALLAIGAKILAVAAMAALPVLWMNAENRQTSLAYLVFLALEMLCILAVVLLLVHRWLSSGVVPPEPLGRYDGDEMAVRLKKRAARDRAAIRGAVAYRRHHAAAVASGQIS
ncbi:hypothetical protein [Glutamicibacter protophormiae]|uniref:hypothetical protein n=1 Tax=Glutamicibacter protophormiae TaxID=37930 RepID=UPI003A903554